MQSSPLPRYLITLALRKYHYNFLQEVSRQQIHSIKIVNLQANSNWRPSKLVRKFGRSMINATQLITTHQQLVSGVTALGLGEWG
jgi:hypothetical protein